MLLTTLSSPDTPKDDIGFFLNNDAQDLLRELVIEIRARRSEYQDLAETIRQLGTSVGNIRNEMNDSHRSLSTRLAMLRRSLGDDVVNGISEEVENVENQYVTNPVSNNGFTGIIYTFPLASRVKCNCFMKIVVNHAVAGLYIGKNGTHLKRLQSQLQFKLTQSGRGARGDFTGVGYPCHRTNTTLLFEGQLLDIMSALKPLYRIIQNDMLSLDVDSQKSLCGRVLKVKFELNLVVPADRKRILLQDTGRRCTQLRNISGVDIIAGKQNFELGNIRESIVTLLGFEENVERACEWLGIFIQESPAITSGDYGFMDYPKYTLAIPEGTRR
ncbi:K Homology domain [Babesia duncani]|uniref:K Homology domain n=1 Tax=Babesia duncani TaxID=323732 RepID=A0AAD9UP61_9APIC|nr:K Homology domain [Babesia duncani]